MKTDNGKTIISSSPLSKANLLDSYILTKSEYQQFVLSNIPGSIKELKLLWRGSSHGWLRKDFHDRCDSKGPTITLF